MKGFVLEIYINIYNLNQQFCSTYKMIFNFSVSIFISKYLIFYNSRCHLPVCITSGYSCPISIGFVYYVSSGEKNYYTQYFKSFGWAAGEIHASKVQICQDKLFLCRIQFLWGKLRHNVWDMLMYLNIKEGENEWNNPLINQENNSWTCYCAAYCEY